MSANIVNVIYQPAFSAAGEQQKTSEPLHDEPMGNALPPPQR